MSPEECAAEGHVMYSDVTLTAATGPELDWCIRCSEYLASRPAVLVKGKRREVDDVGSPEGLL